jgi:AAA domain
MNWEDKGWEDAARDYHAQRGKGTPGTNPQADKPPEPKPTIRWQYHDEKQAPPTPCLIKKLLPRTGAGLISGQWGTFKTTVALDMSVSVMAGTPFAGRFVVKRRGGVAYFAPEGAGGLKSRLDAIAKERGVAGALPFAWCAGCPPLMAPDALDQLARMAKEAARYLKQHFGVDLVLIFIDTIIAAAGYAKTGDDNDAAVGQKVMKALSDLSARTGALVLGIDHFGKTVDTGTRGSSVKEGHADVVLALLGERQLNGTITKTCLALRKMRDGPSGLEMPFTPRDIVIGVDEDGEETRKVIDWCGLAVIASAGDGALTKNQQTMFSILYDAGPHGLTIAEWNKAAREAGIGTRRKADLHDCRSALKAKKLVHESNERWIAKREEGKSI